MTIPMWMARAFGGLLLLGAVACFVLGFKANMDGIGKEEQPKVDYQGGTVTRTVDPKTGRETRTWTGKKARVSQPVSATVFYIGGALCGVAGLALVIGAKE